MDNEYERNKLSQEEKCDDFNLEQLAGIFDFKNQVEDTPFKDLEEIVVVCLKGSMRTMHMAQMYLHN